MSRNELLKSIGFNSDFISVLEKYEVENPEFITYKVAYNDETVTYHEVNEGVINISHPDYINKLYIGK